MGERRADDEIHLGRRRRALCDDALCQLCTLGRKRIHLPVAGNDFLSHFRFVFIKEIKDMRSDEEERDGDVGRRAYPLAESRLRVAPERGARQEEAEQRHVDPDVEPFPLPRRHAGQDDADAPGAQGQQPAQKERVEERAGQQPRDRQGAHRAAARKEQRDPCAALRGELRGGVAAFHDGRFFGPADGRVRAGGLCVVRLLRGGGTPRGAPRGRWPGAPR